MIIVLPIFTVTVFWASAPLLVVLIQGLFSDELLLRASICSSDVVNDRDKALKDTSLSFA